MRFVPVKNPEQQAAGRPSGPGKLRQGAYRPGTNQMRGLLAEFGIILPVGLATLRQRLAGIVEDVANNLPTMMRELLARPAETIICGMLVLPGWAESLQLLPVARQPHAHRNYKKRRTKSQQASQSRIRMQHPPTRQDFSPVMLPAPDQWQHLGTCIAHIAGDVQKTLPQPHLGHRLANDMTLLPKMHGDSNRKRKRE